MKYKIKQKPSHSMLVVTLDQNERIVAEAGAMTYVDPTIEVHTRKKEKSILGSLGLAVIGGQSFWVKVARAVTLGPCTCRFSRLCGQVSWFWRLRIRHEKRCQHHTARHNGLSVQLSNISLISTNSHKQTLHCFVNSILFSSLTAECSCLFNVGSMELPSWSGKVATATLLDRWVVC